MAKKSDIEKVKSLAGIPDSMDAIVEFALDSAEETVKNYCHLEEIPKGLHNTILRMAVELCRQEGYGSADGAHPVKSVTIGDTSTTFGDYSSEYTGSVLKKYEKTLNSFRKVIF